MKSLFRTVFTVILSICIFCITAAAVTDHEHVWGNVTFSWSKIAASCEACFICTDCDTTEIYDCTITSEPLPPDGNGMGGPVYTATVTVGNQTFSSTKTVPGTNAGHNYSAPAIRWSGGSVSMLGVLKHILGGLSQRRISLHGSSVWNI